MLTKLRCLLALPIPRTTVLGRGFGQAKKAAAPRKAREAAEKLKTKPAPAIEDIKSSVPLKMAAFEKLATIDTSAPALVQDSPAPAETITVKGKTYVPQLVTAEQFEAKRLFQKKKGIVDILRKIRSLENSNNIYDALRHENIEDVYHAINSPSFSKMAPQHILKSLIYAQKTRLVKLFQSQALEQAILKVATYLKKLSPTEVASFAVFLSKARLTEERYYDPVCKFMLEHAHELPLRALSNVLYSFGEITRKQSVIQDYHPLFKHCELIIALHLRENDKVSEKDLVGVAVAYSKAEAFSPEFRTIMEETYLEKSDQLTPKTLLNLLHSFTLDSYRSDRLFARIVEKFEANVDTFDLADLCLYSQKSLTYFQDRFQQVRLKNKPEETPMPTFEDFETELQRLVDHHRLVYARAANLKSAMNLLDLKALFSSVTRLTDTIHDSAGLSRDEALEKYPEMVQVLEALMENFMELKHTFDASDIAEFVKSLPVVAEVQSEQSLEYVKELKYRLKKALEKSRPQGMVDDMRRSLQKVEGHPALVKTFKAILE